MATIDEIYHKFGFVSEVAQLLETELGALLFHENAIELDLLDNPDPIIARDIYDKVNKHTLGRLINNSKSKIKSLEKLNAQLDGALIERNRLAHSFFREHNFRLRAKSEDGRVLMMEDLERMHDIILDAYKSVMLISGIDLEKITEEEHQATLSSYPDHVNI